MKSTILILLAGLFLAGCKQCPEEEVKRVDPKDTGCALQPTHGTVMSRRKMEHCYDYRINVADEDGWGGYNVFSRDYLKVGQFIYMEKELQGRQADGWPNCEWVFSPPKIAPTERHRELVEYLKRRQLETEQ